MVLVTTVVDVVVVLVLVVVVVVVVVVAGAESAATTSFTQPSTTVSRAAAGVVLEQSVAEASLAMAAANLVSASARHSVGSVSLVSCFDRHFSFADAFLAAAATFFESHLLSAGVSSGWLPPPRGRCSHMSRSPRSPRRHFPGTAPCDQPS